MIIKVYCSNHPIRLDPLTEKVGTNLDLGVPRSVTNTGELQFTVSNACVLQMLIACQVLFVQDLIMFHVFNVSLIVTRF